MALFLASERSGISGGLRREKGAEHEITFFCKRRCEEAMCSVADIKRPNVSACWALKRTAYESKKILREPTLRKMDLKNKDNEGKR